MAQTELPKGKTKLTTKQDLQLLRTKINDIVEAHKRASIDLCMAVYESDTNMMFVEGEWQYCWQVWGYKSWEQFLGKEMDLHITTAYCLKKVWEVFYVDLVGKWNQDLLLGITKMKILSSVGELNERNVEKWLKKAKGMTCRELRAAVFPGDELFSFAVLLTNAQMKRVRRSINNARGYIDKGEDLRQGDILTHILDEWTSSHKPKLRVAS